jgi:hypothetical protein
LCNPAFAKRVRISTSLFQAEFPVIEDRRLMWQRDLGADGFRVNKDWIGLDADFRTTTLEFTIATNGIDYELLLDSALDGNAAKS